MSHRNTKQFMTDPETVDARIYVGNLKEGMSGNELEEKFGMHGRIMGVLVNRGFGFIQFETGDQARAAIDNENGTNLAGRRISVRKAENKSKGGGGQQKQQPAVAKEAETEPQQPSPVVIPESTSGAVDVSQDSKEDEMKEVAKFEGPPRNGGGPHNDGPQGNDGPHRNDAPGPHRNDGPRNDGLRMDHIRRGGMRRGGGDRRGRGGRGGWGGGFRDDFR